MLSCDSKLAYVCAYLLIDLGILNFTLGSPLPQKSSAVPFKKQRSSCLSNLRTHRHPKLLSRVLFRVLTSTVNSLDPNHYTIITLL